MKWILYFLTGLVSACVGIQHAVADAPAVDQTRTVIVQGPIMRGNIFPLVPVLHKMATTNHDPINILLDSPGGSVSDGSLFINEIRGLSARGIKIRCYAVGMAASMAFQILANCDERYTLDRAMLLWHRVSVSGVQSLNGPTARMIARDLTALDNMILRELDATMGVSKKTVRYHFNVETLHMGENLARLAPDFIESAGTIEGLLEAFHNPKTPRSATPKSLLDMLFGGSAPEYMYIWRNAPK